MTVAAVELWGTRIGAVSLEPRRPGRRLRLRPPLPRERHRGGAAHDAAPGRAVHLPRAAGGELPRAPRPRRRLAPRPLRQCPDRRLAGAAGPRARQLRRGRAPLLHRPPRHGRARVRACPRPPCDREQRDRARRARRARVRGARSARGGRWIAARRPAERAGAEGHPPRRHLRRRRPGESGDRLEPRDERGALGAGRRRAGLRALAPQVRRRRGQPRQGARGSQGLRRDRVRVRVDGAGGRHRDERLPAARGERSPPLHDPPLRPRRRGRQAPPAVPGGARPLRLQPGRCERRTSRRCTCAAGSTAARRRPSSCSAGWCSTSSPATRTTT